MEGEIREKLRAAAGDTTPPALRFAPGPVPSPGAESEPLSEAPEPTPADEAEATAMTSRIEDPALRDAVRRAVAASLARGRADRAL
jgi:hypothetical protein